MTDKEIDVLCERLGELLKMDETTAAERFYKAHQLGAFRSKLRAVGVRLQKSVDEK